MYPLSGEEEDDEPGIGELASWVGSAMRRTSKAVGSAASTAAAAVIKRCAAGPDMAASGASGMLSSADFDAALPPVSDEAAQAAAQVCAPCVQ